MIFTVFRRVQDFPSGGSVGRWRARCAADSSVTGDEAIFGFDSLDMIKRKTYTAPVNLGAQ